jgi:hypothetical protein
LKRVPGIARGLFVPRWDRPADYRENGGWGPRRGRQVWEPGKLAV